MKKIALISILSLIILACGSKKADPHPCDKVRLPSTDYKIISEKENKAAESTSIDVRLQNKISEAHITEIANFLQCSRTKYNKVWIFYYLPNMNPGSGAWATSHFTPWLKVEIIQ